MVERVHLHLKEGLKARGAQTDWPQYLPWVLLNIRTAPKTDSNILAAEMVYGTPLNLLAQPPLLLETPGAVGEQQRGTQTILTRRPTQLPSSEVPTYLAKAEMVYVRRGCQVQLLAPLCSGPYKIMEKGPKYFTIKIGGAAPGGHSGLPQAPHWHLSSSATPLGVPPAA